MIRYLNETLTYRISPRSNKRFDIELKEVLQRVNETQKHKYEDLVKKGEARVSEIKDIKYATMLSLNAEASALIIIEDVTYYTKKRFDEHFNRK